MSLKASDYMWFTIGFQMQKLDFGLMIVTKIKALKKLTQHNHYSYETKFAIYVNCGFQKNGETLLCPKKIAVTGAPM